MLSNDGTVNQILMNLGLIKEPIWFLGSNQLFQPTMIILEAWKEFGFAAVIFRIPLIIAPKPAVSSSATQSFEKKRNSSALFAREINLVTQPSFDCEQGINSQVQTACSNADAIFPVLGIVSCRNERFSLSRKTHVPLWNEPRISHVRLP